MFSQPKLFFPRRPAALTKSRSLRLATSLRSSNPRWSRSPRAIDISSCANAHPAGLRSSALPACSIYGEPFDGSAWAGSHEALVVPRPGTVSPWSSKATDIARNCGFDWIARIERGMLVMLRFGGLPASQARRSSEALHSYLHDRMTESVIDPEGAVQRLFEPAQPRASSRVALGDDARAALQRANVQFGLALSVDEIDYLARAFADAGRDPTDAELMMFAQSTRALPSQDLQCPLDDRRHGPGRLAVRSDPLHACDRTRGNVGRLSRQRGCFAGGDRRVACCRPGRGRSDCRVTGARSRPSTSYSRSRPTIIRPPSRLFRARRPAPAARSATRPPPGAAPSESRAVRIQRLQPEAARHERSVGVRPRRRWDRGRRRHDYGFPGRIADACRIMLEGPIRRRGVQQRVRAA